jgi:hypothetical protein
LPNNISPKRGSSTSFLPTTIAKPKAEKMTNSLNIYYNLQILPENLLLTSKDRSILIKNRKYEFGVKKGSRFTSALN